MADSSLALQIQTLPDSPGVYQFYDKDGKILYVGKAKNLKKRVSSYFQKQHDNGKTRVMVSKIIEMRHIVVGSEADALLLENNLIKKHRPRYNVMLRDDKTYPWICIKKERFPRVFSTRKFIKDGSEYYGPYTSMRTVRTLLELIRSLYSLRNCSYDLAEEKIVQGKYKRCLEYHLGNCLAPCEGLQDQESYMEDIDAIRSLIKGNLKESLNRFRMRMNFLAENMRYEEAQKIKERILILENYQAKSTVVNPKINNVDVFTIISDESYGFVNFLQLAHGSIIRSHTLEIKKRLDEADEELLILAITELRTRFRSTSKEIYTNLKVSVGEQVKISQPKLGDKQKIVEMSLRNAKAFKQERFKQIQITDPNKHTNRIMVTMMKDLRLPKEPRLIECFDNSNIQGKHPVAACVVFKDGKPSQKDYRHFNIKTVVGPDDFASMEEIIHRRYSRQLEEGQALPQLIIIDGGKGQLSAALKSLERLGLRGVIPIIGIAKGLEEIYFPGDSLPLYLDKKSESLRVIQHARNEAHRFGISFHRRKRNKSSISSELEQIEGIGKKTAELLIQHFKSAKRVSKATVEELTQVVGSTRASAIVNHYNTQP